jgi:hypothetical protein
MDPQQWSDRTEVAIECTFEIHGANIGSLTGATAGM